MGLRLRPAPDDQAVGADAPPAEAVQQEPSPSPAILDIGLDVAVRAAQQQTGAAAAAMALMQGKLLVCRARVGSGAPSLGIPLNETSGITGACVRTGEVLYCSDADTDPRVDSCFCREVNIASILVVPILDGKVVTGIVEVLSPRVDAFNATHVGWLRQLAEFIQVLRSTTTLARTKSILQTIDEKAETGQPTKPADGAASRQADEETGIAAIRDILQQRVGTETWDEIGQELVSRFRIHESS